MVSICFFGRLTGGSTQAAGPWTLQSSQPSDLEVTPMDIVTDLAPGDELNDFAFVWFKNARGDAAVCAVYVPERCVVAFAAFGSGGEVFEHRTSTCEF